MTRLPKPVRAWAVVSSITGKILAGHVYLDRPSVDARVIRVRIVPVNWRRKK